MVGSISVDELERRLDEDDVPQVVDIRNPGQFRQGHVPGAINVPFPEFPQRVDDVDWAEEIVVACPKGKSSLQAARMLESYEGVDPDTTILNLDGGYREWDGPLENGEPSDEAAGDASAPF